MLRLRPAEFAETFSTALTAAGRDSRVPRLPGFRPVQGRVSVHAERGLCMRQQARTAGDLAEAVLDRCHLARMTGGESGLERDVLELFDTQAALLIERMRASEPPAIGALAHTLKGSALGIGALQVARAAEAVEQAADVPERAEAMRRLADAVTSARGAIAQVLRG